VPVLLQPLRAPTLLSRRAAHLRSSDADALSYSAPIPRSRWARR
jgi:hypothetical protein